MFRHYAGFRSLGGCRWSVLTAGSSATACVVCSSRLHPVQVPCPGQSLPTKFQLFGPFLRSKCAEANFSSWLSSPTVGPVVVVDLRRCFFFYFFLFWFPFSTVFDSRRHLLRAGTGLLHRCLLSCWHYQGTSSSPLFWNSKHGKCRVLFLYTV